MKTKARTEQDQINLAKTQAQSKKKEKNEMEKTIANLESKIQKQDDIADKHAKLRQEQMGRLSVGSLPSRKFFRQ